MIWTYSSGCTTHKAACGIETCRGRRAMTPCWWVAPPTKPRAALKQISTTRTGSAFACCTTHKAACGIETPSTLTVETSVFVAPPTKPRAALKPCARNDTTSRYGSCTTHKAACGIETGMTGEGELPYAPLHHPQSRVRH